MYQLRDTFSEVENRRIMSLIVGLGSPHGDDQLGWITIDRLRPLLPAGISRRRFATASSCSTVSKDMTRPSSSTPPRQQVNLARAAASTGLRLYSQTVSD